MWMVAGLGCPEILDEVPLRDTAAVQPSFDFGGLVVAGRAKSRTTKARSTRHGAAHESNWRRSPASPQGPASINTMSQ